MRVVRVVCQASLEDLETVEERMEQKQREKLRRRRKTRRFRNAFEVFRSVF